MGKEENTQESNRSLMAFLSGAVQSTAPDFTFGGSEPQNLALCSSDVTRWDENAGLRRDAIRSQVIDALEAQEIKETGNEED